METNQQAGTDEPLTQSLDTELDRAISAAAEKHGISLDDEATNTPASEAGDPATSSGRAQVTGEGSNNATAQDSSHAQADDETQQTKDNSGTQASRAEREGEERKGEEETASPEESPEEKLSPYAKRRQQMEKERTRLNDSWKQLEAEKAEVRKLREELEQARSAKPARQQDQYSAADYEAYAQRAEERGEYELAETARQQAEMLKQQQRQQADAQQAGPQERAQLERAQFEEWGKARAELPELADPQSELTQSVRDMLRRTPALLKYPNGPALAARYVAYQRRAARVPELEAKVKSLQTKLNELEQSTSVGGGSSGRVSMEEPAFEALSLEDQRKALQRELAGV